jgi:hypothetical protein
MSTQNFERQQQKGRRHLLDLNAPRPVTVDRLKTEDKNLTNVQRWVMSTIAVTTLLHMAGAAILAAIYVANPRLDAHIGLNAIAGLFGVGAVASWLGIHGKRVLSPWLLLGALLFPIGLWLTLGR